MDDRWVVRRYDAKWFVEPSDRAQAREFVIFCHSRAEALEVQQHLEAGVLPSPLEEPGRYQQIGFIGTTPIFAVVQRSE
jgi:hypothetical protein